MNEIEVAADKLGIEPGYYDVFGHWHAVSPETLRRLMTALAGAQAAPAPPGVDAAPVRAFQGDGRRVWGLAVQLYALRSCRNWGHGDFGDLNRLMTLAAARGASAVGLNPLHALFPDRAGQASPYAPNSRLFLNVLYIDVAAIPEFPGVEAAGLAGDIAAARAAALIDYPAVAGAKLAGLRAAYAAFDSAAAPARRADFEAYRAEQGDGLLRLACFEVLRMRHAPLPWPQWPEPWRQPDSATLLGLRADHRAECEFQEFMQWVAARQLQACKDESHRLGMSIGLYTDLAVGIDPHGADAWSRQDAVLAGLSIGAPPDEFNTGGQDWGLAPFNPHTLAINDFEPLRQLMRAAMSHAGAVRMDHVLGLNRMYLIPRGLSAREGAYVRYPFEAVLRVIAEESNRARCIVIGEDLGTVPDGFRETMARWGLWTYRVMLFEREHDGRFRQPETYPAEALATFNTHDLPTFRGWFIGDDLATRHTIGIDPGETEEARAHARETLRWILTERAPSYAPDDIAAVAAVLAQTPSRLVTVGLDDILDVVEQINIPGTVDEHPNWRRKLPVDVEDLGSHPGLQRVAQAFAENGRGQ
ncbi:MAG: 4-alpha-glucanotransferase [Pseudolabrys sp.]|nr:4-alpha-glucanotransferase [Pseudolabrys sp.]MDP2296930.1 4-alpha-glucanotransferase [Pseudolabrys sp.]